MVPALLRERIENGCKVPADRIHKNGYMISFLRIFVKVLESFDETLHGIPPSRRALCAFILTN
jgi:hypothetical protein